MSARLRIAVVVVFVSMAGLGCGSSGARAEESQSAANDFLKSLTKMAAAQVFTGTVTVTDSAALTSNATDTIGTSKTTKSLNHTVTFTVTKGSVVARIVYEEKVRVDSELRYQGYKVVGVKTEETSASGTRQENASVAVDLRSGGMYQIHFGSGGGVEGLYTMLEESELICTDRAKNPTCNPGRTKNSDSGKPPGIGGLGGSVDGKLDAKTPNVLRGSTTQQHELNDGSTATRTVAWNLSR